ncbi:MAG: hypothetical protein JXR25_03025 [Pontiellaceae bacterium]|nr:hypothetical protein [Pontiellaceae bacterium]
MSKPTIEDWKLSGVTVAPEVDLARIAVDAVIHPGCRISGEETSIGPGCVIGAEAPATVDNCQLGRGVELKGGFFSGSTFMDGSNMGSGAHVRAGTILEEEAGAAHSVGFKQTVFLPFVTAGSLINFCDALMAGGTSRRNHSEIGSSYVHFNFTPHQDKATPSLIGDVPNGVFLDRKPVFLGGQGGLVGPARLAYGTIIAAGGVCRKDILKEDQLHIAGTPRSATMDYTPGVYRRIEQIVRNNLIYIGNIDALRAWYAHVRVLFVRDVFDQAVLDGGIRNLNRIHAERVKQLGIVAEKMEFSIRETVKCTGTNSADVTAQRTFLESWPAMKETLCCNIREPDSRFIDMVKAADRANYVKAIHSLSETAKQLGRVWLQSIVNEAAHLWSC